MKKERILISAIPFISALALSASPLVTVGDFADISFDGTASLKSDSNIFRIPSNEVSDTIFTLSPGLSANLGKNSSNLDIQMSTSLDFNDYQDRSELNHELFHINTDIAYRGSRLDAGIEASFDENKTNTGDANLLGDLAESEISYFKINAEYAYSPKISYGVGYNYRHTNYVGNAAIFQDLTRTNIPFKVFYELTSKMDLSVGYTRGRVDAEENNQQGDSNTNYYNVGLRGSILPKLNGSFDIGFTDRNGALSDSNTMGANLSLSWLITPKLILAAAGDRGYTASINGGNILATNLFLNCSYSVNDKISLNSRINFTTREYDSGRQDDLTVLGLNASYIINTNLSVNGNITYNDNDSSLAASDYSGTIFGIACVFKY